MKKILQFGVILSVVAACDDHAYAVGVENLRGNIAPLSSAYREKHDRDSFDVIIEQCFKELPDSDADDVLRVEAAVKEKPNHEVTNGEREIITHAIMFIQTCIKARWSTYFNWNINFSFYPQASKIGYSITPRLEQ